jgi:hypothetical protein
VPSVDQIENAALAAVVRAGLVDVRALGGSEALIRRLDPLAEAERREADTRAQEIKAAADRAYWSSPDVVAREVELIEARIESYVATIRRHGESRVLRRKVAEAETERAKWLARLESAAA